MWAFVRDFEPQSLSGVTDSMQFHQVGAPWTAYRMGSYEHYPIAALQLPALRSEERRVGNEC